MTNLNVRKYASACIVDNRAMWRITCAETYLGLLPNSEPWTRDGRVRGGM